MTDHNNFGEKDNDIEKLLRKQYYMNYFLDPIQYDFRTYKILYYFHRNNEPLFYLALSYTSKILLNSRYRTFHFQCCFQKENYFKSIWEILCYD